MKTKKLSFSESLQVIVKAIKVSVKTKAAASVIVSILGFAAAFLPMFISIELSNFSNLVQGLFGKGTAAIGSAMGAFLVLSVLYIVQLVFRSLQSYFARVDSQRIIRYIKEYILRCTCTVKYKYLENYDDFKDKVHFVETDAGKRVAESMQTVISILQDVVTFVSLIIILWAVDAWIVVILCATCIPAVILAGKQKDEEYLHNTKWTHEFNVALGYFFEASWQHSMNDLRFYGIYDYIKNKWREMVHRQIDMKNQMTRKHVAYNSVADIFRNGVYIVILLIAAKRIFDEPAIGIGAFMLVFTMAGQLHETVTRIFVRAVKFFGDAAYMKDFFDLEKLEYENIDANAAPLDRFDIKFENVSFTYPNTEREILHGINVQIKEGEKVAIVGENGSGKSTFIALLCALYDTYDGKILLGGEEIAYDLSRTRRTISAAFQDFGKYETTIRENITISDYEKSSDDDRLKHLCKKTGAWEFISRQENGLDETIGTFGVSPNNLSGGEWQKLATTRCAYRDNAKIMILDEPTAALDPMAEANLYRNFSALTGNRTTILISHRLGITQLVDRILVFDNGRIIEDGNYSVLMEKDGIFAKLYQSQAQLYK